jgi:hypothetical protein
MVELSDYNYYYLCLFHYVPRSHSKELLSCNLLHKLVYWNCMLSICNVIAMPIFGRMLSCDYDCQTTFVQIWAEGAIYHHDIALLCSTTK